MLKAKAGEYTTNTEEREKKNLFNMLCRCSFETEYKFHEFFCSTNLNAIPTTQYSSNEIETFAKNQNKYDFHKKHGKRATCMNSFIGECCFCCCWSFGDRTLLINAFANTIGA